MSTPDRIIFNKELGVGLTSITDELCKQTLSNYQVFFRSEGIVGEIAKELNIFYENHLKLPIPLLEAPKRLNFRTTKKNFYLYTSNLLAERELSMSNKTAHGRYECIYLQLDAQDYHNYRKTIKQSKLTKRTDYIKAQATHGNSRHNGDPKLISWQDFITKLLNDLIREKFIGNHDPPLFFKDIINNLCLQTPAEKGIELKRTTHKTNSPEIKTDIPNMELPDYQQEL
jgi:hypothetical protein